jgi:putative ABC transport system permease protein
MHFLGFIVKNLIRRPVRSALTVLGLAVAVGTMIALRGISHNVETSIAAAYEQRGVDLVVFQKGVTDQLTSDLDHGIVDRVRAIPGVTGADAAMVELVEVPRGTASSSVILLGWPPENAGYNAHKTLAGRRLAAGDRGKAMLGSIFAQNHDKGVGDTVTLQGEPFEVVGVYQSFVVFENGAIIVPLEEAQRLAARPGRITGFSVYVRKSADDPTADVEAVRQAVVALTDPQGKPAPLSVQQTQDYVDTLSQVRITRALVWLVSAIALVIGVISMLNTMVMSVLERTQEIGILRAVGWPRGRVVRMVLGEAVVLGVVAAAFGTLGAAVGMQALTQFPRVNGFIEGGLAPVVVLQGLSVAALIGLIGGAYPAYRAARLLPTEAIRHD